MNKLLSILLKFLFIEKYEIKTRMKREDILGRIQSENGERTGRYKGRETKDGFVFLERVARSLYEGFGRVSNGFAPMAYATLESDGDTEIVNVVSRMYLFPMIVCVAFRVVLGLAFVFSTLLGLVYLLDNLLFGGGMEVDGSAFAAITMLPIFEVFIYFVYRIPAKKLKARLMELIVI